MVADWKTDRIANATPQAFYELVERNRQHIYKTFPVTATACESLEKTNVFLQNAHAAEQDKKGYYFYIRKTENELIGYICIKSIDTRCGKCELAYFIDENYQGQGIITKAVGDVIAYCFGALTMNKIFICTSKNNIGSQKVATKNGFIQEGILREEFKNGDGLLEDILYFGLLQSDYKK